VHGRCLLVSMGGIMMCVVRADTRSYAMLMLSADKEHFKVGQQIPDEDPMLKSLQRVPGISSRLPPWRQPLLGRPALLSGRRGGGCPCVHPLGRVLTLFQMSFCGAIEMAGIVTLRTSLIKGGIEKFAMKQPIFMVSSTPSRLLVSKHKQSRSRHLWIPSTRRNSYSRGSASTSVSTFFFQSSSPI
jgi:hypothetical protein